MLRLLSRLTVLVALVATACAPTTPTQNTQGAPAPNPTAATEQRADQQSIKFGVAGLTSNLTPAATTGAFYFFSIYDSLTSVDAQAQVQPWIATKWDLSADGLTWSFTLRNDVKWPDGSALTADDVAFSFNTMLDKKWPGRSNFLKATGGAAPNPTTFTLTTSARDITVLSGTPYIWILPKAVIEKQGLDAFIAKPIGSGPYEIADYHAADSVRLVKKSTPHPFRKPLLDEITVRAVAETTQQINGLRTGEIDISSAPFTADQATAMKKEGITIIDTVGRIDSIVMTQSAYEQRKTPLNDKRVRQALNYAIDKETLLKTLFQGYGQVDAQFSLPFSQYYDPSVKPYPYDMAKAEQLMADAGYPNGFKLPGGFDYTVATSSGNTVLLQTLQAQLKQIGVEFDLNAMELGQLVDKVYGKSQQLGSDFIQGGNGDPNGLQTQTRLFYGCGKPGAPYVVYYCDQKWDDLMDAAYAEPDAAKRKQIFLQANQVFRDDVPLIFLYTVPLFVVHTSKLRGVALNPGNLYNLDTVYKVK